MNNIICIAGPTASGKTALAVELAKEFNGEVVSCDSMYVYKYMNIGTAKPSLEEQQGIPHHMIDVAEPDEDFSVSRYCELASPSVDDIISRGKTAIIAGGTGLYMDALIKGNTYEEKFHRLLSLTRQLAGDPSIDIDEAVYLSEKATGNKNRALAYLLKTHGLLAGEVEDVLDCYFRACSISVNCQDLARIAFVLANHGPLPQTAKQPYPAHYATYVNAVMMTCGMYDGSGNFAINVGVPAKSGVGGGIMAVVPGFMGIGIFSPALDSKGNSVAGIRALELLSRRLQLSVF